MPDIGLIWDPLEAVGDWARDGITPMGADDGFSGDLTAAVMVSLFTDRRATEDDILTDGTDNRRGCWTDSYEDEPIGSRLWLLQRSKTTTIGKSSTPVLLAARDYCNEALNWLVRDQIATAVDVQTFWARKDALGIVVMVTVAESPVTITLTYPLT